LAHSSIQVFSRSFRFWGCRWATQSFSSLHRFSIGFRSGDWLGHSRTLKCFLRSHSLAALAVCCHAERPSHNPSSMLLLRERGCWPKYRDTWPHPSSPQYGAVVLSPLQKSTPKTLFPPPCFTVGMVFLGLYSSFFFLQTQRVEFIPKSYILVSSDHMTFSHASSGSSRWSLANFRRAWTCAGLNRGTLGTLQDFNP